MKHLVTLFVLTILICNDGAAQHNSYAPSRAARKASKRISTNSIMTHVRFLSLDMLEGRAPSTRGDRMTQAYISAQMRLMGLKPGGDSGTYIQRFPIVSLTVDPSIALTMKSKDTSLTLAYGSEFVGNAGRQQPHIEVNSAELVFVGYGIDAPEQQWNDYKNVDVRGKILLFMNNDPSSDDPKFFGGSARTYYGRWTYKFEIAARKGAAGAIVMHTTESAGYGWNVVENSWTGEQFELAQSPSTATTLLNVWTSTAATERLMKLSGHNLADLMKSAQSKSFSPVPLGITLSAVINTTIKTSETANVIGVLPGRDPKLKHEAVVLTAHHDHLGITKPVDGDSINNGALDNATGVSALINIAKAFVSMKEKSKRSVVFVAVGAEESGALGSQYYVEHPTFPLGKIAANINIDGINIFGKTKDVIMIGYGKSSIDKILQNVAGWQKRTVKPDQFPEQGSFYRSDQFNFAKVGIPCMYLDAGVEYIGKPMDFAKIKVNEYIEHHYHQPSDEIGPDWNLSGAVEDVRLTFLVANELARIKGMPRWNTGDEFEAARLQSLGK